MNAKTSKNARTVQRRQVCGLLAAAVAGSAGCAAQQRAEDPSPGELSGNALLWAVAWKQTAAEYFALCHQAYNLARLRVDEALRIQQSSDKPLAVITDMDDTIMHAASYWGHLIKERKEFFVDEIWDEWLPHNDVSAAPGAMEFFEYCHSNGIEIFYVTNRDQGERTFEYALLQLQHLGFPGADADHLTVFRETSDKSPARDRIRERFKVAVILGDNLNDYQRDYYVKDIDERMRLMERDRKDFGREFVLLPNPTDGHWVRAIFGDSEPLPTAANRRILMDAATRRSWQPG